LVVDLPVLNVHNGDYMKYAFNDQTDSFYCTIAMYILQLKYTVVDFEFVRVNQLRNF